jgi:hypothetical protein
MLALLEILSDEKKWITAREISGRALRMEINLPARIIGELASASGGEIIGHGKGYKLMRNATDEDILEAYGADFRRALGSEQRARQIISFARCKGRLQTDEDNQRISRQENQIREEVKKDPAPGKPESYEEVSLF